jgi:hypothetical protein
MSLSAPKLSADIRDQVALAMAGRADVSSELILQHSVGVAKLDCVIDRRVTPPSLG